MGQVEINREGIKLEYQKTLVKKSASLGANATILCGTIIGRYAFIGAGSVVINDIPDFALVVGNPGKIIGWVNEKGQRIIFNKDGASNCGRFFFSGDKVIKLENS